MPVHSPLPLMILVYSTYTTPTYLGRLDTIHPSIHNTPKTELYHTILPSYISDPMSVSGLVEYLLLLLPPCHKYGLSSRICRAPPPNQFHPFHKKHELQTYPSVSTGIISSYRLWLPWWATLPNRKAILKCRAVERRMKQEQRQLLVT
ncbi:hypothetical protein DFP73DRAFT_558490 [Morchella snyderi]|nr:hypothetical protein DFP73DRAFT_558490 [Morchella snyderi]